MPADIESAKVELPKLIKTYFAAECGKTIFTDLNNASFVLLF